MNRNVVLVLCATLGMAGSRRARAGGVLCQWGPSAKEPAIAKCGVPRLVRVGVPTGSWKFYFVRDENPGLSGYYHKSRGVAGPVHPFLRKVNLVNTDLYLCPADFKNRRVLAFQQVDRRKRLLGRPTCTLGMPGETPKTQAAAHPAARPGSQANATPGMAALPGASAASGTTANQSATMDRKVIQKGGGDQRWRKIDRLARALALVALILALLALVGVGVAVRYFQKRLRESSNADSR
ncbi:MAG: hypothetical protein J7M25_12410 [Deltaproteobacteria bacterium]|nr:hypothetical protein [Deltaproteobacteria bacterium]